MDRLWLARVALSSLCGLQGLATVAIDFNRTHATNPTWTGHARFHVVWQTVTVALLSGVELGLIASGRRDGFYLALVLAAVSPVGFLVAVAGRGLFGGTLSDPNGVRPVRGTVFGVERSIDLNVVAVVLALIALAAIEWMYRG